MKNQIKAKLLGLTLAIVAASQAQAAMSNPVTYLLTITNGGNMPVSPIAIYTENGQMNPIRAGEQPTPGFIQLCQTGNPSTRIQELGLDMGVTFKTQTMGLLMPGQSTTVEVKVNEPLKQTIHFETMYGKTKDICAVAQIGSHSLYALQQHATGEVSGKDNVLQTGAFLDPAIPAGKTYLDMSMCENEADAVSCLRSLSAANMGMPIVRFFSSYLSSVQMLLETKYGAAETQSLLIPSSGAVQYRLKLKH